MGKRKIFVGQRVVDVEGLLTKDGEIIPLKAKLLAYIPRHIDREPYVKVYQDTLAEWLYKGKLKKSDFAVLFWFIKQTDWENNWIYVDYKELAKELNLGVRTIKQAIKSLKELNLIVQLAPRQKLFRLNPRYIYKGGIVGKEEDIDF